jgi:MHS family proline/betaine transporter-like MFS transporter
MASNVGTLCGNLVGALLRTILTDEQLYSWGWRLPFLSGILIAFVGIYLRYYVEDPNIHGSEEEEKEDTHWEEVFRKENLPALGSATLTPMVRCSLKLLAAPS